MMITLSNKIPDSQVFYIAESYTKILKNLPFLNTDQIIKGKHEFWCLPQMRN